VYKEVDKDNGAKQFRVFAGSNPTAGFLGDRGFPTLLKNAAWTLLGGFSDSVSLIRLWFGVAARVSGGVLDIHNHKHVEQCDHYQPSMSITRGIGRS
jgi:hypothetical protein